MYNSSDDYSVLDRPELVRFVSDLPRSYLGKVLRRELVAEFGEA